VVETAACTAIMCLTSGPDRAMNRYNRESIIEEIENK
jgi:hypothetical protein